MSKKFMSVVSIIVILGGMNVLQFYYFTTMLPQIQEDNAPLDLESVLNGNKADYIGQKLTLDGFYLEGGSNIPLLVTDPFFFVNNSLKPSNYLKINGTVPSTLKGQQGARVHLTGVISWADSQEGLLSVEFDKYELIKEAMLPSAQAFDPTLMKVGRAFPYRTSKYVVLISGGINPDNAHSRYWNDITAMYTILTWFYGYDPDNIYVVYKDGTGENDHAPCHGPATHVFIQSVFTELEGKMTSSDDLFIYTTNHGGYSGLYLWSPLDPYLLTPAELNDMLSNISYNQEIIVMEQCFSGGFIPVLSQVGRVILTACGPMQSSYACDYEGNWDEFVFHFMSAVIQANINGDPAEVNSDTNSDGKVSMYEAFMYASAHDSLPETPYYDDNGDGIGNMAFFLISLDPAIEGLLGMNTFL